MRNVFMKMALSAALVLALGLPSLGFAAEAAPAPADHGVHDAKPAGEGPKMMMDGADTMMHMKDMSKGEMMMQQGKGMMDKNAPMTPGRKKMMEGHDKMMQGKKMMMEGHTMMMDGKKMMDMEAAGAPKQ
ncbi:hypothetical protein [Nitratidesulfovibrio sp. SRB-5]|uniref:hypothetical protein n=1 Tax=Nitratidesulfovibrio sp. SRB-5 TaxID=2872636 RepID=UPI00102803D7|nr:hypothetical protein [Nitratidesulfovibrio sp. SRB-5]MBZ2172031.1 hypothetical protein [Nitratidesulfovibrio sp. SRB-5]RXF77542.1 hypothetical protein EKK70_06040 [Desulfovibrio sp. DS-1]